jgi:hypothetical protein
MSDDLRNSPIFLAILGLSRLPDDSRIYFDTIRWIYSWHVFLAKAPLTRSDLYDSSETDWIIRQQNVLSSNDIPSSLLECLRITCSFLFDENIPSLEKLGKHGPGSTNKGFKSIPEKQDNFEPSIQSLEVTKYNPLELDATIRPQSNKLEFVPKDIKSLRPITMESISMQHAQQSLKRNIYRFVDKGLCNASHFIRFKDQTISQSIALYGSRSDVPIDMRPVTIDLSSASDMLSVDVVINAFSGDFLHDLLCCRSWDTITSRGVIEVSMYGGMGSATTFPVQTLIFTAISLMAVCKTLYKRIFGIDVEHVDAVREFLPLLFPGSPDWKYFKNVRVYGDDIIVPHFASDELLNLLRKFGLIVNVDKSFLGFAAIREACGIFAIAGVDITPVRYRLPIYNIERRADYAIFEAWRSLANRSFIYGYRCLHRFCVRKLRGLKPFISHRELSRKNYGFNCSPRPDRYACETLHLSDAVVLFEPFRGKNADYIGVISTRDIVYTTQTLFGERRCVKTAYTASTRTRVRLKDDDYFYGQSLYEMTYNDVVPVSHGRIPRGIRMHKRSAYLRNFGDNMGWAWAPS